MSQMKDVISEIYPFVHPEIQKDLDKYIKTEYDMTFFKHVFSNKIYYRHLGFNYLLGYNSSNSQFMLYSGGLGMGYFMSIYYTITKGYSIELSEIGGYHKIYYMSNDWLSIKDEIDKYFESIMPEDSVLKLAVPLTQIYKKELIQTVLLRI
jgi:hypothetical protein